MTPSGLAIIGGAAAIVLEFLPGGFGPAPANGLSTVYFANANESTEGLGRYTGNITYDESKSEDNLNIHITNTTVVDSRLTGFGFNITGDHGEEIAYEGMEYSSNLSGNDAGKWKLRTDDKVMPYGYFEWGVAVGNKLQAGSPKGGLESGQSGDFSLSVTGGNAADLEAADFITESAATSSSKGPGRNQNSLSPGVASEEPIGDSPFVARFQSVGTNDDSDKVIAHPIPAPATAGAGLVMFGCLAGTRRRRGAWGVTG